jgi:hypothetical protein
MTVSHSIFLALNMVIFRICKTSPPAPCFNNTHGLTVFSVLFPPTQNFHF